MNLEENHPKLTPEQLVAKMKSKNIRFDIDGEADAVEYLRTHNNYYRTASYRKNYEKYQAGDNAGKYIDLDFAYLTELATVDMHLRLLIIKMCLDIEHSLKVKLLSDISENNLEDGYSIVIKFLEKNSYLLKDIFFKRTATYVGDLINKHFTFPETNGDIIDLNVTNVEIHCPIWAFMEIITFGDFTKFYSMYYEAYQQSNFYDGVLSSIKSLRNACAHNNCIVHNLKKGSTFATKLVREFVASIPNITKSERQRFLSSRAMYELTTLVYLYNEVVFEPVKKHGLIELYNLVNFRMKKHEEYFKNQETVKNSYLFFKKIVDFLVLNAYNIDEIKKL